jgi:hypothetical protein
MITGARGARKCAFCLAIFADTPLLQQFGVCAEVDKHGAGCILASESATAISIMKTNTIRKIRATTFVFFFIIVSALCFCLISKFASAQIIEETLSPNSVIGEGSINWNVDFGIPDYPDSIVYSSRVDLPIETYSVKILDINTPYTILSTLIIPQTDVGGCSDYLYGNSGTTTIKIGYDDFCFAWSMAGSPQLPSFQSEYPIHLDQPLYINGSDDMSFLIKVQYVPYDTRVHTTGNFSNGEAMISLLLLLILTTLIFHTFWARVFGTKFSVPFYRTFLGNNSKEGKEIKNI